jgi:uncharacterized protein YjbJ (UPF0337 family)
MINRIEKETKHDHGLKEKVEGAIDKVKGEVKEVVGKVTDNKRKMKGNKKRADGLFFIFLSYVPYIHVLFLSHYQHV